MYHVRHRVYDPARMLWIQRDPLGRIPGANEYAYCLGEPIDFYDPMGLDGWWLGSLARDAGLVELGEYLDDTVDGGAELVSYWKELPSPRHILEDASDPEARQDVHDALRQAENVANQIPGGQLAAGGVRVADSLLTVFDAYVDGDRAQTPQVYILGVGNVSTGSPVGDAVLNVFVTLGESSSQASGKGGGNKRSAGDCTNSATSGKEPPQLARGKRAHKEEPILPGERDEVSTRSGKRMDRYNEETAHIREIKPNNQRSVRRGQKQVDEYKKEMEAETGRPHTTEVTTYDPAKYDTPK